MSLMSRACSQGMRLPTHTELILNIFAIHRVPNVWENLDAFKQVPRALYVVRDYFFSN
jgi:hypothetical protein